MAGGPGAWRANFGLDELGVLDELRRQAVALQQLGRFAEAEAVMQDVCERRSRQQGDGHPDTLKARLLHAGLLWQLGHQCHPRTRAARGFLRQGGE